MINSLRGTIAQSIVAGSTDGSTNANIIFSKNPLTIDTYIAIFSFPTDWKDPYINMLMFVIQSSV